MKSHIRFWNKEDCVEAAVLLFKKNDWTWANGWKRYFVPRKENIEHDLSQLENDVRSGCLHTTTGRLEVGLDEKGLYYGIVPDYTNYNEELDIWRDPGSTRSSPSGRCSGTVK